MPESSSDIHPNDLFNPQHTLILRVIDQILGFKNNNFYDVVRLRNLLDRLDNYIGAHFNNDEIAMKLQETEDIDERILLNAEILNKFRNAIASYGGDSENIPELFGFAKPLWINHMHTDNENYICN